MEDDKFLQQLKEDIKLIQDNYVLNNPLLKKDEYAFNYWVLSKLYNVDEEYIDNSITEYSDDGCDCYVFLRNLKNYILSKTNIILQPH